MKAIREAIERTKSEIERTKNKYWEIVQMNPDDIEDEFQDIGSWRKYLSKVEREISRLEGRLEGYELSLGMVENED